MDVIGFLCISLDSSTVQVHDNLGSRHACACSEAGFSSQNDDRVWGCNTEEQRFFCAFLWAKGPSAKNIHKEMFPVCGGKYLSRKAVHIWVEKFSQGHSKVADDARPGAEIAETTVKRLLCCGFRRPGKAIGQVYQCWWRICRETNVLSRFECHIFYFVYPFVTYLLTLPRTSRWFLARLIFRPWKWRRDVPPKHRLTFNGLHSAMSHLSFNPIHHFIVHCFWVLLLEQLQSFPYSEVFPHKVLHPLLLSPSTGVILKVSPFRSFPHWNSLRIS
jgi:hypothetical protein